MSEAAPGDQVRCAPRHPWRGVAMIASMPLLFAGLTLGRTWLDDAMFGAGGVMDGQLIAFVVALLCVLWIVPAYWMATAMLSTITISNAGVRRSGVPGAGLFIPWSAVTHIAQSADMEGWPALLIRGAGGRIALSGRSHERGDEAMSLAERIAAARGLAIEPPSDKVRRMLEQRRSR